MKIAVTDAIIFIDLIETQLLGYLFDLEFEVHTTYEVYNQLNTEQERVAKNFVQSKSLLLYSFSFEEILEISEIDFPSGLETADRTVYYYATKIDGLILTGDNKLRKFCESKKRSVKGVIWVFDQIVEKNLLTQKQMAVKMQELLQINSRLPKEECTNRITKWNR